MKDRKPTVDDKRRAKAKAMTPAGRKVAALNLKARAMAAGVERDKAGR